MLEEYPVTHFKHWRLFLVKRKRVIAHMSDAERGPAHAKVGQWPAHDFPVCLLDGPPRSGEAPARRRAGRPRSRQLIMYFLRRLQFRNDGDKQRT